MNGFSILRRATLFTLLVSVGVPTFSMGSIQEVATSALPAIVVIDTPNSSGSGVLIESSGVVVTSLHVIEGAASASITLANGDVYDSVSVISADQLRDIALLRIQGFDLPVATMGNSNEVSVGDDVILIGAPRGMDQTVTRGIISAIRDSGTGYRLFQTDAAISPGSSGGGMFDTNGRLVGIAVSYIENAQNINFVVPINYVRGILSTEPTSSLADFAGVSDSTPSSFESLDQFMIELNTRLDEPFQRNDETGSWYIGNSASALIVSESGGVVVTEVLGEVAPDLTRDQMRQLLEQSYLYYMAKIGIDGDGGIVVMNETPLEHLDFDYFAWVLGAVVDLHEEVERITGSASQAEALKSPRSLTYNKSPLRRDRDRESTVISLEDGGFSMGFDSSVWSQQPLDGSPPETALLVFGSDTWIQVITEEIELSYEVMADIIVINARALDPNAEVVDSGFRLVNGEPMYWAYLNAEVSGVRFGYYYHVYTGPRGTVQLIGWTSQNVFQQRLDIIEEFVSGFVIN